MKGNETLGLVHGTTAHTSKLLHVAANTQEKTQVDAEGSDVGTGLTADPENTEVSVIIKLDQLALVDGSNTELTLDGRDQRGTLEERAGQGLESTGELGLATGQLVVKANDCNILLSSTLLGLDKTSSAVNANDQATSDLGIKGTAVTSLLHSNQRKKKVSLRIQAEIKGHSQSNIDEPEHALDPSDDLVTRGIGRLIEVDDSRADVRLDVALQRRAAIGNGGEVTRSNENCQRRLESVARHFNFWKLCN